MKLLIALLVASVDAAYLRKGGKAEPSRRLAGHGGDHDDNGSGRDGGAAKCGEYALGVNQLIRTRTDPDRRGDGRGRVPYIPAFPVNNETRDLSRARTSGPSTR
jgi:hypothetical protein